jgi:hypothetical protein
MAKLKATPTNFAEALAAFDSVKRGSRIGSIRIGNNTYLESYVDGCSVDRICVRLHETNIVEFWADGRVILNSGGYRTVTTKERINQFIRPAGRIHQDAGVWYYSALYPDGAVYAQRVFEDGLAIQR